MRRRNTARNIDHGIHQIRTCEETRRDALPEAGCAPGATETREGNAGADEPNGFEETDRQVQGKRSLACPHCGVGSTRYMHLLWCRDNPNRGVRG